MRISRRVWWLISVVVVLVVGGVLLSVTAQPEVKNPDTLVVAARGDVFSFEPTGQLDGGSYSVIRNLYEKLCIFKEGSSTELEPRLAAVAPSYDNGLVTVGPEGKVYVDVPIREGVYFHYVGIRQEDGSIAWKDYDTLTEEERGKIVPGHGELTPEDVKYTYMRAVLENSSSGALYGILKALTGEYTSIAKFAMSIAGVDDFAEVDEASLIETFEFMDRAITVKGNSVEFCLPKPYAPFTTVLFNNWNDGILDKEWVIAQGGWPGTAETWKDYHDPATSDSVLYEKENGTGPFKLVSWDKTDKIVTLKRFDGYWRGPAKLENIIINYVAEWGTRRLMLQAGDADIVSVDQPYIPQVEEIEGVVVEKGLPSSAIETLNFNWTLPENSPGIGSGQLDGEGIPADFFSDINVRKGFCYAFDYEVYIDQVLEGLAARLKGGPIPPGVLGYRDDQPQYDYDPAKATEYFKQAYDGKLWEVGFKFIAYTSPPYEGRTKHALDILQERLLTINPKFQMEVQVVQWSTFLGQLFRERNMPIWTVIYGWDWAGPVGTAAPWLGSGYFYAPLQGENLVTLLEEKFDPVIDELLSVLEPAKREVLADQLQRLSYEYAIDIFIDRGVRSRVTRDWLHGLQWYVDLGGTFDYWGAWKGY